MKIGKKLINYSAGIAATILTALPSFSQESTKYAKMSISPITWSNGHLEEYYNTTYSFQGGLEYAITKKVDLGWNMIAGSKKVKNKYQKSDRINYLSANFGANIGLKKNKKVSVYMSIGTGIHSLEERNNNNSRKTKSIALGGHIGPGLEIKLGKNSYLFGEIKENIAKIVAYNELWGSSWPKIERETNMNGSVGNIGIKIGLN